MIQTGTQNTAVKHWQSALRDMSLSVMVLENHCNHWLPSAGRKKKGTFKYCTHPVARQTLNQTQDGAVEDVGDDAAVARLLLLPGAHDDLSCGADAADTDYSQSQEGLLI